MVDRRGAIQMGALAGLGGLVGARPDQQYFPTAGGQQIPGSRSGRIRANQVIITGVGPNAGLFVYSGTPALGNPPVLSVVAPGVTHDPFGNTVAAVLEAGTIGTNYMQVDASGNLILYNAGNQVMIFNPSVQAFLTYSPSVGANNLITSIAPVSGTDSAGNAFLAGVTNYQNGLGTPLFAVQQFNGQTAYYSAAHQNGPWTLNGTITADTGGDIRFVPSGSGQVQAIGGILNAEAGLDATTTIISDTVTAAHPILEVVNLASSITPILRLTTNAAGDLILGGRVSGDTNSRLVFDTVSGGATVRMRFGAGNAAPDLALTRPSANQLNLVTADFDIATVGRGLKIATGANARMGSATLVAGTVTVANTTIQGTDFIFLSRASPGGTLGQLSPGSVTVGSSFVINSNNAGDTSLVNWLLIGQG